eukprot:jgi/Mesen1/6185/ME000032S05476
MEFKFEAHPESTLHLFLFSDVTNSEKLVQLLQAGTLEPELAFFNAALVPSTFPVLVAASKALTAGARGQLRTRTVHAELVYNYAASKHIRDSLRRCGISEQSTYVLVARFQSIPQEVADIRRLVEGTEISLEELGSRYDMELVKKQFKIAPLELETVALEDAITCRIAAREAL